MKVTLIRGGRVIDPINGLDAVCDVLIEDGVIRAVGPNVRCMVTGPAEEIDATGLVVAPGFVDPHVHFREPGTEGETISTGSNAAVAGGYTTVCVMPNTNPAIDNNERVAWQHERGQAAAKARVRVIGALTAERAGKRPSDMLVMSRAGIVGVSDDGSGVQDAAVMLACMRQAAELGLTVSDHAEDSCLSGCGVIHEGSVSKETGVPGKPSASEWIMVHRDISLASVAHCRLHIAHASAIQTLDAVRIAKDAGAPVSVEVTPHHLVLVDDDLIPSGGALTRANLDTNKKMNPPLRAGRDRAALIKAVREGVIDAIATDHAPHPEAKKALGINDAPNGVIGLETTFPVLNADLVQREGVTLPRLIQLLTVGPAMCLGLSDSGTLRPGSRADVVILDVKSEWRIDPTAFRSMSRNTPFSGRRASGRVVTTIVGGMIVYSRPLGDKVIQRVPSDSVEHYMMRGEIP